MTKEIPMPFTAPAFSGDYSDLYGCITEATYFAVWLRYNDLEKHLQAWNTWLNANKKRLQLTDAEQAEWTGLCETAVKLREQSALNSHALKMVNFWEKYMGLS